MVGIARRADKIDQLAKDIAHPKAKLFAFQADLTKEEDIVAAFQWTLNNVGPVHILVNNAGVHFRSSLIEGEIEIFRKTINTNLLAVCITTKEAITIMKTHNINGYIININSIFGHNIYNVINLDIYPSTKYGVTAFSECLRLELMNQKSKIRVTVIKFMLLLIFITFWLLL